MRVYVYFNLRKRMFSIKALEGENKGRVIAHAHDVMLKDVTPKVSEAGRQRVLKERRKNVHAGLVGKLWGHDGAIGDKPWLGDCQLTYNPYKFDSFVSRGSEVPVTHAQTVVLSTRQGIIAYQPTFQQENAA